MQLSTAYKQRLVKAARIATAGAMVVSSVGSAFAAPAFAAQLSGNSTTLSDSRLGAVTSYAVAFIPPTASLTSLIGRVDVKFCQEGGAWSDTCTPPAGFNLDAGLTTSNVTINGNFGAGGGSAATESTVTRDAVNIFHITLTAGAGTAETAVSHIITLTGVVTNPTGQGTYYTRVKTATSTPTDIDQGESAFAVLNSTTVSGRVLETLTFNVGQVLGSVACGTYENSTVASTTTTIPFGNFISGTPRVVCQTLSTATNAGSGYATTVEEVNHGTAPQGGMCRQTATNCNSDGGQAGVAASDVIGDTGLTSSPAAWTPGTTFGLGVGVSGAQKDSAFTTDNTYRSIFGNSAITLSKNSGPTTAANSTVYAVYKADVSGTQTAGLYQNSVMYVTTGTF